MRVPIIVPSDFRIIAHRGASAYAPENTSAAFALARKMRVREFELDTQLSSDGTVILCHDLALTRYGYGPQVAEQMTWAELTRLDMGAWFSPFLFHGEKMLTLPELFREYQATVTYHIELKGRSPRLPEAVCHLIKEFRLQAACIITSFAYDRLMAVKSVLPHIRLAWLTESITDERISQAQADGLFQLCPRVDSLTAEDVKRAHSIIPEVRAWGLQGSHQEIIAHIQRVINTGCDGMTINWPDWVSHRDPHP